MEAYNFDFRHTGGLWDFEKFPALLIFFNFWFSHYYTDLNLGVLSEFISVTELSKVLPLELSRSQI